ncbi:MAG: 1-deoxy-D-xylulose-5-phosphate synthase [Pseudomonadota bacterium]
MKYLNRINDPEDLRHLQIHELPVVAAELRQFILEAISKKGGHLGSAMGAVELAVALHYVFESPRDRLIWDVGHQAHAHKILTGRRDQFFTMKQDGGLSGFLKRTESPHDIFGAGHASTSISAALGIREALRLKDGRGKVVAIVGDGGIAGGMALEALNHAGALKRDLIVVLNDNGMSIGPNVGALSEWFSRKLTGGSMTRWRKRVRTFLEAFDSLGDDAIRVLEHLVYSTKNVLLNPGVLFEGLGFEYVGPIDGHDLASLVETFRNIKNLERPVLVHAITSKGKGYPAAEKDCEHFHGVGPFDLHSGKIALPKTTPPEYTTVFGNTLCELAESDPRVVAITAAMAQGTGLEEFAARFPGRFYDVGIAEEHAVTFAAGLASEGFRPVCAIYSTFLQRGFDQVLHDVCLQNLPVTFCMDRAGLVGPDGPTHHGVFDIAYLRIIPNMSLMAPKDENELRHMLATALKANRPVAIRYPKGAGIGASLSETPEVLPWGKAEVVYEKGHDLLIVAVGPMVQKALAAAEQLTKQNVACTVINARFVKPLDESLFTQHLEKTRAAITIEEGCLAGGFGTALLELKERLNIRTPIRNLGIPDRFINHGSTPNLYKVCGLAVEDILEACEALYFKSRSKVVSLP